MRIRSVAARSAEASPAAKPSTTGTKVKSPITMILGIMPKPNQTTISGAMTGIGTVWEATIKG